MTKTIDTLVEDIYAVINDRGGWDSALSRFMSDEMHDLLERRFGDDTDTDRPSLRMSNMGTPCERKLWYSVNSPNDGEPLPPKVRLKFLYGDILELLLISLAMAAGHDVRGCQDELHIAGIRGHRDCVIDGITVDVKSASSFAFKKFREGGGLRGDDPFGYLSQLSSYVAAGHRDDPSIHPTVGCFLVIDKVHGDIVLDRYEFSADELDKEPKFERIKALMDEPSPPARAFQPEDDGYRKAGKLIPNGNKILGVQCSYCEFKEKCWPDLRTFMYKGADGFKPKFFTHVAKEPRVDEVNK